MTPQELIDESNRLIAERYEWDAVWNACARYVLPMHQNTFAKGSTDSSREAVEGWSSGPKAADRLSERYDITGILAAERLATGVISLVTPDNEKWQDLGAFDPIRGYEPSDEETRWLEMQRDYLLTIRYNALTGWTNANAHAMRSNIVFGLGLYSIEEAYGRRGQNDVAVPYTYSPLPLSENYLTVDGQGQLDQDYRRCRYSARIAYSKYGEALSPKIKAKALDPKKAHEQVDILHWVGYRQEKGALGNPMRSSMVDSWHVEVETKHVIRRGGFHYWPIVAYHWNQVPNSPYGESPVMLVLAEIKGGNILAKNTLLSAQQLTRPPVATADENTPRPNLNPAAINYGAIDTNGRLKIQPIITAQNPSLVKDILEMSRNQIKEGLYTNLWQILIQNPQMTATEALIRANEKGELLGPIGTKIQHGLSMLTEAELTILRGKGAWEPGSVLAPPKSLGDRDVKAVKYNSPLDRLRRSGELVGIQRTLEILMPMAEAKPGILDKIDEDAIADIAQQVTGAPRKMFKSDERIAEARQQAEQQAQIENAIQTAGAAGAAAEKAIPAAQAGADMLQRMAGAGAA